MLPFIHLFGREIGSYGICAVLGLSLSALCLYLLRRRHGIAFEDLLLLLLISTGGMVVGGSVLYGLTHIRGLISLLGRIGTVPMSDFVGGLKEIFGGMVFYGGFLGAILSLTLFSRKIVKGKSLGELLDLYALTVPLFHTFGRIGCFLGGCCYGIESGFGFLITDNPLSPSINGVRRFPVQLVEAALNLAIFFLLLTLYRRGKFRHRLILAYLLAYPPVRFGLEFLRGDAIRGRLWGLSTSQWISLILLLTALAALIFRPKRADAL